MNPFLLSIVFFVIAVIYASAGLGGGSAYGAILGLCGIEQALHKIIAHSCNLVVASVAIRSYIRNRLIPIKWSLSLVFLSIPFVVLSTYLIELSQQEFRIILGIGLLLSAVAMWWTSFLKKSAKKKNETNKKLSITLFILITPILGLLAGMTGIGGGILLAPLLYILKPIQVRSIAACTTIFIFCNSLCGIWAIYLLGKPKLFLSAGMDYYFLLPVVLIGGYIGSKLANQILPERYLTKITIVIVSFAGIKLTFFS